MSLAMKLLLANCEADMLLTVHETILDLNQQLLTTKSNAQQNDTMNHNVKQNDIVQLEQIFREQLNTRPLASLINNSMMHLVDIINSDKSDEFLRTIEMKDITIRNLTDQLQNTQIDHLKKIASLTQERFALRNRLELVERDLKLRDQQFYSLLANSEKELNRLRTDLRTSAENSKLYQQANIQLLQTVFQKERDERNHRDALRYNEQSSFSQNQRNEYLQQQLAIKEHELTRQRNELHFLSTKLHNLEIKQPNQQHYHTIHIL